jgi:hypothetical protein
VSRFFSRRDAPEVAEGFLAHIIRRTTEPDLSARRIYARKNILQCADHYQFPIPIQLGRIVFRVATHNHQDLLRRQRQTGGRAYATGNISGKIADLHLKVTPFYPGFRLFFRSEAQRSVRSVWDP